MGFGSELKQEEGLNVLQRIWIVSELNGDVDVARAWIEGTVRIALAGMGALLGELGNTNTGWPSAAQVPEGRELALQLDPSPYPVFSLLAQSREILR